MRQGSALTPHRRADYAIGMMSRTMGNRPKRNPGGSRHGPAAVTASALVLLIAFGFSLYAMTLGGRMVGADYGLRATFLSSSGLQTGADVLLAGVPVGIVTSIALDDRTMLSDVNFRVENQLRLPADSRVSIGSSTLTSANALMISPGKSPNMLEPGATLTDTCGLSSLEQEVSQYIFGSGGAPSSCGADG